MKKLALLLILIACQFNLFAQKTGKEKIDSLLTELTNAKEDTNKVKVLISLANSYRRTDFRKAIEYAKKSDALSSKLNNKKFVAQSNYILGNIYTDHSDLSNSLYCYNKALEIEKDLNDKEGMASLLNNIAANYHSFGDYPKSIETNLKALKLFEEIGNKYGMANCYINIGNIYLNTSDNLNALNYFQKAYKLYDEIGNKPGIALSLNNIGSTYSSENKVSNSLNAFSKALKIYQEIQNEGGIDLASNNIAESYTILNEFDKALEYGFKALQTAKSGEALESMAYDYKTLSGIYYKIATTDNLKNKQAINALGKEKALKLAAAYIDSSMRLDSRLGILNDYADAAELAAKISSASGNYKEAYEKYKLFKTLNDSVFNIEKDKKITQSAMQYTFDKKEAAAKAEQDKKNIRQRNIRNAILGTLIGSLIFLLVVYRQRNKIAKEKARSEELLLNILPEEVAEELKANGSAAAKQFDEVTVMFTDFKGFTKISEKLTPSELVAEIHTCFRAFDNIITKYNIEKIKTIGDAYMCAGGLPVTNKTNAIDVVQAAIEIQQFMLEHMQQQKNAGKEVFEIRIGIHTGPVVAGIVGVKKFAYDIWGDTVNIASRMESSGEAGKVNISDKTYELVKGKFNCIHRGKIEAKNKGEIDMYFVEVK